MEDVGLFNDHLVSILRLFGIFYGHLAYFMAIWYILWNFGVFFPVLVCCVKKNLAALFEMHSD
jgi:hypothetical protein